MLYIIVTQDTCVRFPQINTFYDPLCCQTDLQLCWERTVVVGCCYIFSLCSVTPEVWISRRRYRGPSLIVPQCVAAMQRYRLNRTSSLLTSVPLRALEQNFFIIADNVILFFRFHFLLRHTAITKDKAVADHERSPSLSRRERREILDVRPVARTTTLGLLVRYRSTSYLSYWLTAPRALVQLLHEPYFHCSLPQSSHSCVLPWRVRWTQRRITVPVLRFCYQRP